MTQAKEEFGFDIDALESTEDLTVRVSLIEDIEGNAKSGFIIVGKDSKQYRDAAQKIRVGGLMRASKRKQLMDTSTEEGAASLAKAMDDSNLALAASVVVDWFGFGNNGAVAKFDPALVKKMLVKYSTWQDKVLAELEKDANFIKG